MARNVHRRITMEKDIVLGKFGSFDLSFVGGKAQASLVGVGGLTITASDDAGALLDFLFALIEAHSPAGAVPIEEVVKVSMKTAIAALK